MTTNATSFYTSTHVYRRLLEKIERERDALGGKVFDILGKLTFDDRPLRQLLLEAIRYGDQPKVRDRLNEIVDHAMDHDKLRTLIEDHALVHDSMDATHVRAIREDMERAEARRLQPHFIASFFLEAFTRLGGTVREREPKRFEITHVPPVIRGRDRMIGVRDPVLTRYERVTFDKGLISIAAKPVAEFLCPGHPLLDATIDLILERYRDLLKRGAVLIDETDPGEDIRAIVYLEHSIQDARTDHAGNRRVVSRQVQFAEVHSDGTVHSAGYAPYLDYRPPTDQETPLLENLPESGWLTGAIESRALSHAVVKLVPEHITEVKSRKETLVDQSVEAVKARLTSEIKHWNHRAEQLKQQELAGKVNAKLNSAKARQRADELTSRLQKRMDELAQERRVSPLPPNVIGGAMIVPLGLLLKLAGETGPSDAFAKSASRVELAAMEAVMVAERALGCEPRDVSAGKCGYDIESKPLGNASHLRFIKVKGHVKGDETVTLTRNEILTALNRPEHFILAIVEVDCETPATCYVREPFTRELEFNVASMKYKISDLLAQGASPS